MRDGVEGGTHFLAYFQPFCVVVVDREKVLWDFLSARDFTLSRPNGLSALTLPVFGWRLHVIFPDWGPPEPNPRGSVTKALVCMNKQFKNRISLAQLEV